MDVVASSEMWRHDTVQPAHAHEFLEIVVVRTGRAIHRMRAGSRSVAPGSVLLVRPGQWHAYDEPADFSIWNLYVPQKTLSEELTALRSHPVVAAYTSGRLGSLRANDAFVGSAVDLPAVEPYLHALSVAPHGEDRSLARLGQLLVILDALAPALVPSNAGEAVAPPHPAVLAATALLDGNPARAWTLVDIAEEVHVSAAYLCRLFAKELGISPLHYLERHRLEHCAQLLLESELSVVEISASTGWSDSNYMARRFRIAYGMSPTRYRDEFQGRRRWATTRPLGTEGET